MLDNKYSEKWLVFKQISKGWYKIFRKAIIFYAIIRRMIIRRMLLSEGWYKIFRKAISFYAIIRKVIPYLQKAISFYEIIRRLIPNLQKSYYFSCNYQKVDTKPSEKQLVFMQLSEGWYQIFRKAISFHAIIRRLIPNLQKSI